MVHLIAWGLAFVAVGIAAPTWQPDPRSMDTSADSVGRLSRHVGTPIPEDELGDQDHKQRLADKQKYMEALVKKYAPILKLSSREEYFPSSVEYMFPHYDHVVDHNGIIVPTNLSLISPSHLDQLPNQGAHSFLSVGELHNPQPWLLDPRAGYLRGPRPRFASSDNNGEERERGRVWETLYGVWVEKGRGIVDIWYWTYYPFNFGKPVGALGWLGHHVSDWERVRIRTLNGTAIAVDFNVHNGPGSIGTVQWDDVHKINGRAVAYVAAGSHGVWPEPGEHVYAEVMNVFRLVDSTDDYGAIWDSQPNVQPIQWWDGPDQITQPTDRMVKARAKSQEGNLAWYNYKGYWGNRGDRDCWWARLVDICQVVDGPYGPNRDFRVPMDCVLARIASGSSAYKFYLSPEMVDRARGMGITDIRVEQICSRSSGSQKGWENGTADGDDVGRDNWILASVAAGKTSASTLFAGRHQHSVYLPSCDPRRPAASSYRLLLCKGSSCSFPSPHRRICAHTPSVKGFQATRAVDVDDLDDWDWETITGFKRMMDATMLLVSRFFLRTFLVVISVIP